MSANQSKAAASIETPEGFAIQAEGLGKVYGKGANRVEALKGIDLTVRPGDFFVIMGPSGSGKTTLLTLLGLVNEPTSGRLVLGERDIYGGAPPDLARIRREETGFIFQTPNLIPFLTAKENVLLPLSLAGVRGPRAEDRVQELLEYLEVAERSAQYPNQLSGGEQQRVAIARALANDPRIILADEPTASLDTDRALAVVRLLRRISREHGAAVLLVTHDHRLLGEVDEVIQMQDGRVVTKLPGGSFLAGRTLAPKG